MTAFVPRIITLRGRVLAPGAIDDVFPLFSPLGEKSWVPNWDPELLFPRGSDWEEGQIFRTHEEMGEAVWIVRRLDRTRHVVEYSRVEPERFVAHIEVFCQPIDDYQTEAVIEYSFIGLSDAGNRDIGAMNQEDYDEKMTRWTEWINDHLDRRKNLMRL